MKRQLAQEASSERGQRPHGMPWRWLAGSSSGGGSGDQTPPKGFVVVRVGEDGEEQRRFAVPLKHLHHPLFGALLDEAEKEYGFVQEGALAIPCRVDRFFEVEDSIFSDICRCATAGAGHHSHAHLPRFVGCFKA